MNTSEHSFDTIVSEHYEALYRFALSLTRSAPDACDLTQQTFYIWAAKGHQLRDASKVKTWLFTTMNRVFLAERQRQTKFPQSDLEEVGDELPSVAPERFKDPSQVLAALAQVDEIYQSAVALFYLEDCSYRNIAVILEVPLGTVKSRIARGIEQLRGILAEEEHDPFPSNVELRSGPLVPVGRWNRPTFPASHPCCDLNN